MWRAMQHLLVRRLRAHHLVGAVRGAHYARRTTQAAGAERHSLKPVPDPTPDAAPDHHLTPPHPPRTIAYFIPELGTKYSSYLLIAAREPDHPYETSTGWGRSRNDTDRACARRCLKDGVGSVFFLPLDRWGGGMVAGKGGHLRSTVGEIEPASPSVARMVDLFHGRVCTGGAGSVGAAALSTPLDFSVGRSQAELLEAGRAALMAPTNWKAHAHAGRPDGAAPALYVGQVAQPFDPRLLRHEGLVMIAELRHPLASASSAVRKARGGSGDGGASGAGAKGMDEYDTFPWEGRKLDKYGDKTSAGAAAKAVLKVAGAEGAMSSGVRSGRWQGGGGSGGSMMDRAQGGRRGVQLDSDNYVVRILANLPTMMKGDVTVAVFRRAKRMLQSFDLVLVGEWEQDPGQRRALLDLLLRNAANARGASGGDEGESGEAGDGVRTSEEYGEQQLSRHMSDDTVAALLGLSDVAAGAGAGAMVAGPSWFVDGEVPEEDNNGRTQWIASHRCVSDACRPLAPLPAIYPSEHSFIERTQHPHPH